MGEESGDDSISINVASINSLKKYFFKNNFVLAFSLMALFSFIFALSSAVGFSLGIGLLTQITGLFSPLLWGLLFASFIISGILAYYEKYGLMFLPIMIWLLFSTAVVRTANIDSLKDVYSGEYTLGPDLDPFLYLRHAIEISEGRLGSIDYFRQAPIGVSSYAYQNIMPWAIFYLYKIISIFSDSTLTYAAIIAPVIFFIGSIIGFFFFVYNLFSFKFSKEKSLMGATIASFFYSFVPAMLHRTVAGIPEIESLGMMWFWLAFLFFTLAWKQDFAKDKRKTIIYGLLAGLLTGLMSWTWGGYRYIYMTLALASFLAFLFNIEKRKNLAIFGSFIGIGLLIEILKTKSIISIILGFTDTGFAIGLFLMMLVNFALFNTSLKNSYLINKIRERGKLPENVLSIIIFFVLGSLLITLFKPSFVPDLFSRVTEGLLYPFGRARIALTVAENRAPYFMEVLGSFGNLIWLFLLGLIVLFYEAVKHFDKKKKWIMNTSFILFLATFIFSRISPDSPLNGENTLSKILYLGGLALFGIVLLWTYLKAHLKKDEKTMDDFSRINIALIVLISFSFWAMVSMRGAIRLFFIIAPMIILASTYFVIKIIEYRKNKDDLLKMFFWILIIVGLIVAFLTLISYASSTVSSVPGIIPNQYNQQWQQAMGWVRDNTPEGSIFVHWWDYGYWVQTIGERPTMTDGAHANEWWDYTTARYLLTTPNPETALSLMKTNNVSYLLIDSTDVGKYSAFSSIGNDETGKDRISQIPTMAFDIGQSQQNESRETRVYQGAAYVDEDIVYNDAGKEVFLPQNMAVIAGTVIDLSKDKNEIKFNRVYGVFFYNQKQFNLPIRYLYLNGELIDFGSGIDAILRVIPAVTGSDQGIEVDNVGAVAYLSPKVSKTLFAHVYLMDDPNKDYSTITIAHIEDDPLVKLLKQQGAYTDDFVYYGGLRGPIKIWKVDYPENIATREEFLNKPEGWNTLNGPWATLDNLNFTI